MEEKINYKNFSVLYLDSSQSAQDGFKQDFGELCPIFFVGNVSEAMKILQQHDIAVVIAAHDLSTAENGIEALKRISLNKSTSNTVRVVLIDINDKMLAIRAADKGIIYRYFTKPYTKQEVEVILKQCVHNFSLEKDREQLYQEKVYTMKKIARANRLTAMGILSAGMTHEINNPLVAISTFLQMIPEKLEEASDKEFWSDYYKIVLNELHRIQNLTTQLVRYSNYGEGDVLKLEWNDINSIISNMTSFITNEAKKKRIIVTTELEEGMPKIRVDKEKLHQVFLNLLLNALQSIDNEKHNGKITITTKIVKAANEDSRLIKIAFRDNGSGISEENLQKLFTPFFTTKNREGSGLGLMTCHQIIDDHRGTIDVKSKMEEGSIFIVKLPINPTSHDRRQDQRLNPAKR